MTEQLGWSGTSDLFYKQKRSAKIERGQRAVFCAFRTNFMLIITDSGDSAIIFCPVSGPCETDCNARLRDPEKTHSPISYLPQRRKGAKARRKAGKPASLRDFGVTCFFRVP